MIPRPFCFGIQCTLDGQLEPNWPSVPLQFLAGYPESAILVHVESTHASQVTFGSRVRELSRLADSAGTEVPVIREDRFSTSSADLVNVPVNPGLRQTLRIYALPDVPDPEVEVRYYRQPNDSGPRFDTTIELLRANRVRLRMREASEPVNVFPAIAEVGNIETFPELVSEETIWIEVAPLTPGLRIFALLSLTDNDTQQVTIISSAK